MADASDLVLEDQSRGVLHLHFVLGHTTALEKAFARAFFRELEVGCVRARARAHVNVRAGCHGAGEVRGWPAAELRREACAIPRQGGGRSGVPVSAHGRACVLCRAAGRLSGITMTITGCLGACAGGSQGLLRNAEDDGGAGAARGAAARPGGRRSERSVSARPPERPSGRVSLGATRERSERGGWPDRTRAGVLQPRYVGLRSPACGATIWTWVGSS